MGVSEADLQRHIAWDIGVAGLGERLSDALGATFISQRYSRLVIDSNRDPARADAIPEASDDVVIPGNLALSDEARLWRRRTIFEPYHAAIAQELDARTGPTWVVSLHSFTPAMGGKARPWLFGVLHDHPSAFSRSVLAALRAERDAPIVGDNEPYRMDEVDFTVPHHAVGRGLDYLELEVRQDLLADPAGQAAVAERLARLLPAALASLDQA